MNIKANENTENIGRIALAMLDGSLHYLVGAIQIAAHRDAIGAYENDPDFAIFMAILAEIDTLPLGRDLKNWTTSNIKKHQGQINQSTTWAKDLSLPHCQALASRYGAR